MVLLGDGDGDGRDARFVGHVVPPIPVIHVSVNLPNCPATADATRCGGRVGRWWH